MAGSPHFRRLLASVAVLGLLTACDVGPGAVRVGARAPEFELPTLSGGAVSNADLAGRPTVVNFWATWCRPCLKEIPTLQKLHRAGDVRVVSIAIDDGGESVVRPFAEDHGIEYPVLLGDGEVFRRFEGRVIPYTLVLDPGGRVVAVHRGYVSERALERDLRRAGA